MVAALSLLWQDLQWELQPELAVYWPAEQAVVIADPHFGKDVSFRAAGIPVPSGTTHRDIQRLDTVIERNNALMVIVLGDFFHSSASLSDHTLDVLEAWREGNRHISMVNIRGNHDSHAGDPPKGLGIQVVDEPWTYGGMTFCHHPSKSELPHLCGHLHPSIRLVARSTQSVVLPCFWLSPLQFVCPAFGGFTGTSRVRPRSEDRLFVSADRQVLEVAFRK